MIPAIVTSLILLRRRSTIEVVPPRLRKIWKEWELRGLVLFSLLLQLLLIVLGNRRRYIPKLWIKVIVWSAYLLADFVATLGLGHISSDLGHVYDEGGVMDRSNEIAAFWAPFLLLHLGGPDTITAYSLEDTTLWLRRFFELLTQTTVAVYIFLMAWSNSHLSILTIPVFIAGVIKYGERTWNLWKANKDEFSGSYEEMTETQEGGKVEDSSTDGTNIEAQAHDLLEKFKGLFANYYPSESDISKSYSLFEKMDPERAFDVIAAELGFMYDQLYTKEKVIYTRWGLACRFITFSLTCSVLIIFCLGHDKDKYRKVDLTITLLLLVFAVLLEIYAALVLLFSDQTKLWFMRREISYVLKPINFLQPLFKIPSWSGLMGQCSLISICVKQKRRLGLYSYVTYSKVPPNLTSLIHRNVVSDSSPKEADSFEYRLEIIFKRYDIDPFPPNYCWSEFDLTILTWHIATEICFYEDEDGLKKDINPETKSSVDLSQGMSRYLMYLLVSYPLMLPIGATAVNFRDLVAHTRRLISKGDPSIPTNTPLKNMKSALSKLQAGHGGDNIEYGKPKSNIEMNVLNWGRELSDELNKKSDRTTRWNLIRDVWLETLVSAAQQREGSNHAQQLRRGGELLTHIWLLSAHLGLPLQFPGTGRLE